MEQLNAFGQRKGRGWVKRGSPKGEFKTETGAENRGNRQSETEQSASAWKNREQVQGRAGMKLRQESG